QRRWPLSPPGSAIPASARRDI
ncbi:MAG: hypothetical protein AVDCRST_MAG15-2761, partial [uncultured Rubellimicrobium sp.]